MKPWTRIFLAGLFGLSVAASATAQVLSINVTSPVNEASGATDGTAITLKAISTGTTGTHNVSFRVNGSVVGTVLSLPSVLPDPLGTQTAIVTWTPPQPGSYFITATAVDLYGNAATSLAVRYFATGTVVNSPVSGTLVPIGSSVVLKGDATPAGGFIKQVQFYDNGVAIGAPDLTAPYSLIYTPAGVPAHAITAQATDNNGALLAMSAPVNLTLVNAITPVPTVKISTPTHDSSIAIGGPITVAIDANSSSGVITKVELYIDGALFGTDNAFPYTFTWTPTIVGTYKLVALAYDDKNNVVATTTTTGTATPEPTRVVIAAPPTVTITAPTNGGTVTGGVGTQLVANATDSGGYPIVSVQFFVDGTFVGQSTTPTAGSTYASSAQLTQRLDPTTGTPVPSIITALATNSLGLSGMSPGVSVNVTTGGGSVGGPTTVVGTPPVVSVTNPTAGTQVRVNSPVVLTAQATDPDGNISSVQFYVGTQSVGMTSTYPYTATWTPTSLGNYNITASATDNDGNLVNSTAVAVAVIDPNPTAPTITVTSPAASATLPVNATHTLSANASDAGSIAGVQFFVNGQPEGALLTAYPFSVKWTPTTPGAYTISARAINASGHQTTSTPISVNISGGTPPVVALATAASSVTLGMPLNLTATVTPGAGAFVRDVQFTANGIPIGAADTQFPFGLNWTFATPGSYAITAIATDSLGNQTTSAPVTVSVVPGSSTAPFVTLTSTPAGANVSVGTPILISAAAGDPDGTVANVSFYVNNQLVGSSNTAPYTAIHVPAVAGGVNIHAVATDNAGNTANSGVSTLFAQSPTGAVPLGALEFNNPKVDTPLAGATATEVDPLKPVSVTYGSKLILAVPAVDQDGTIAHVQFFANGQRIATVSAAPFFTIVPLNTLADVVMTAIVTDSSGNATFTNPIFISTIPSAFASSSAVTLVSPPDGARYVVGRQIVWSATHNFGNVEPPKIDFYVDGMQWTTVSSATGAETFQTNLALTRPGTYTIHAVGRSGNTTTVSAPARISVVGNTAPTVTIGAPATGTSFVVGNSVAISASGADSDGTLSSVQFYVNGQPLQTDNAAPYTATWTPASTGTYTLTALATDDAGGQTMSGPVSVTITANAAPVVSLTAPAAGTTVSTGTGIGLSANASDVDGRVASVRFFANGNLVGTANAAPYAAQWSPSAPGSYTVTAQATDDSGNVTTSSAVAVTVTANELPSVALTSPANGATLRVGSGTALSATASDRDGTLTSVQFFANGTPVGAADTTPPYTVQWIPTAEGIYRITATASDNAGGSTTSSVATVFAFTQGAGDTVYSGTYAGPGENGRFAAVNVRGRTAALIAFSNTAPARTYFFPGLTVDSAGGFSAVDASGRTIVSGMASDTGVSGTMDAGRLTFIGPILFANGVTAVPPGYYNGNLAGRAASLISAIVGPDASIHVYVTDGGSFRDAGAGSVNAAGAFAVTTPSGNRITGTIDPATGFLSGSLTGGPGGAITAALASGSSVADGFLTNLSTRGQVGTGANVLIAGFVVAGDTQKQVLIRAVGPGLSNYGVSGVLADPQLQVYRGSVSIASNDQWISDAATLNATAQAGAFPLSPGSADAAIVTSLAPGAYTAQVSGVGTRTGVALLELYDLDSVSPFSGQRLTNVATRGPVGTGQAQLIAGFMINGNTPKKLLIRGVGPSLANVGLTSGLLADPFLRIVRSDNTVIRENDNWESGNDGALLADTASRLNAFGLTRGSRDAAILISLPPGTYTAEVTGVGTSTGIGLVEVYEVP